MMMMCDVGLVSGQPLPTFKEEEILHQRFQDCNGLSLEGDDYGTVVNPAEITGQSLASKMESDKMNFDLEKFVNDQAFSIPAKVEETQDLIREMEDFLSQYEDGDRKDPDFDNLADQLLSMEQQQTLDSMDTSCPVINGDLSREEVAAAEDLVDELLKTEHQDSGFQESFNVSNVSQFNTTDGNVILVIVPENPTVLMESPRQSLDSSADLSESDTDWVPETDSSESIKKKPGRKLSARQPVANLKPGKIGKKSTIKDKKERKKIQNVMAARRYRDKKKLEAQEAENEEQILLVKNRDLKEQLKDIENEMKTMKKLMFELGLFKVASQ